MTDWAVMGVLKLRVEERDSGRKSGHRGQFAAISFLGLKGFLPDQMIVDVVGNLVAKVLDGRHSERSRATLRPIYLDATRLLGPGPRAPAIAVGIFRSKSPKKAKKYDANPRTRNCIIFPCLFGVF